MLAKKLTLAIVERRQNRHTVPMKDYLRAQYKRDLAKAKKQICTMQSETV